jgi:hypothetical protein
MHEYARMTPDPTLLEIFGRIFMPIKRVCTASMIIVFTLSLICTTLTGCSESNSPAKPAGGGSGNDLTLIADHTTVEDFDQLTIQQVQDIQAGLRFFFGHTSHGSQIVTGLRMLAAEDHSYALPSIHEVSDDLGHNGDTSWAPVTRNYLDGHPGEIEVVMWSWCGGVSDNTVEGINTYLNTMSTLEAEYPGVIFVYMTGHLDGSGEEGNLRARNNQIRAYCAANNKVLFDFADIESYDPDEVFYPDETDACQWCVDWCADHTCPGCSGCAHSHCYNCYLKGKAFWCLMAAIMGLE